MKKSIVMIGLILSAGGCQKAEVPVPTVDELVGNPKLLAEWNEKCTTGEYAHLLAREKADRCWTVGEAQRVLAAKAQGEDARALYEANTIRN